MAYKCIPTCLPGDRYGCMVMSYRCLTFYDKNANVVAFVLSCPKDYFEITKSICLSPKPPNGLSVNFKLS